MVRGRDPLCLLIKFDADRGMDYAADFCVNEVLSKASREWVEYLSSLGSVRTPDSSEPDIV